MMYAGKFALHTMGHDVLGSDFFCTVLCCVFMTRGTTDGTGSIVSHPVWGGAAPDCRV